MSKILKNPSAIPVAIDDCGSTVPASNQLTIDPNDYATYAASSDVIKLIANATLILNDGGTDIIDVSDAIDIIKGWAPSNGTTTIVSAPTFFFDFADIPSGIGPFTLISFTNTGATNMNLSRVQINCRVESMSEIKLNGITIGGIRTGPARPSEYFQWFPTRPAVPGDLIEVILTKRVGAPDVSVSAHVMGTTDT